MNMKVTVVEASQSGVTLRIEFPRQKGRRPQRFSSNTLKMDPSRDWSTVTPGGLYEFADEVFKHASVANKNPRRVVRAMAVYAKKAGIDAGPINQIVKLVDMMAQTAGVPDYNACLFNRGAAA